MRGEERGKYEGSGYFSGAGRHLTDPESRFQRYRTARVAGLCGPLEGRRVVDLGCGWGTISFHAAKHAALVVGVDFARSALEFCRDRLGREGGPWRNLHFVQADAGATGLRGGRWDLVVAADLVEHLHPAETLRVYREAFRLLAPGGRFVIWTPNPGHFLEVLRRRGILRADPTHVDYKPLRTIVEALEGAGFRTEVAGYAESHVPVLGAVERLGMAWVPGLRRRIQVVARKEGRGVGNQGEREEAP